MLGAVVYANTLDAPFQFDDRENIVDNPLIRDFMHFVEPSNAEGAGIPTAAAIGWKSRLAGYLTFALNYRVHGFDIAGYHILNIAIHIVNALLLYWLVVLTFRTPFLRESSLTEHAQSIALFSGLLFVSHPIQTQAVTYIVQRFASLATLFYLLSMVLYVKCRLYGALNSKSIALYALSLALAVLAMKTKEMAFTLPIMIALYEFLFFGGSLKKRFLYLLPLALTMLIIPLTLFGVDRPLGEVIGGVGEAARLQSDMSRADYLFTQFRVIATYIRLLFLPLNQNLDYDYPTFDSFFEPQVFLSFVLLLSVFGLGIYLVRQLRSSEPAQRFVSFGIFWFFITLSVESSIIPISDVIFEHRLYLPSVAFFPAFVAGIFYATEKLRVKKTFAVTVAICIAVVISLSIATYERNKVWRTEVSLWEDVVRKSPNKSRPHYNFARFLSRAGFDDKAMAHYRIAIALNPRDPQAHFNIGVLYLDGGLVDEARKEFETALKLNPRHPEAGKFLKYVSGM
jgi:tetratricopeptide (TPR) repeat protein